MFGKKEKHVDQTVFAIKDSKSNSFNLPMFSINSFTLLREIENLLQDPSQAKNQLVSNSEDFDLFEIGTYDRQTGKLEESVPKHICSLHSIKQSIMLRNQAIEKQMPTLVAQQ